MNERNVFGETSAIAVETASKYRPSPAPVREQTMANPSLAPAPAALATLQPQTQQTLTQGKIITVPGIPGHFIQVFYTLEVICQAF